VVPVVFDSQFFLFQPSKTGAAATETQCWSREKGLPQQEPAFYMSDMFKNPEPT